MSEILRHEIRKVGFEEAQQTLDAMYPTEKLIGTIITVVSSSCRDVFYDWYSHM